MAIDTDSVDDREPFRHALRAGVAGGLVGGIGMGVVLHAGANMMHLVGAVYGSETVAAGWIAHLAHSVALGGLFAVVASRSLFVEETATVLDCVVLGTFFAGLVGLVTGGMLLPVGMSLSDGLAFPEPILPLAGALGEGVVVFSAALAHVVYGILLGGVYGFVHRRPVIRATVLERETPE